MYHDSAEDFASDFARMEVPDLDRQVGETVFEITSSSAFRRLKKIRFLGAIDYLLVPHPNGTKGNVRYTRYQHSVGVARLANLHSRDKGLSSGERLHGVVAALVHDLGHAPLSHSLEPLFAERFGLNHHLATAAIISGRVQLGTDLHSILRSNKIDVERVLDILNGGQKDRYDGFFSGPINFDTIEAILRSQTYVNPRRQLPAPTKIMYAAIRRSNDLDCRLVDSFWNYKNEVYRYLINSHNGILADAISQFCMRQKIDKFSPQDYYSTERSLFEKIPDLYGMLTGKHFSCAALRLLRGKLTYKARSFTVDQRSDFFSREDQKRYRQVRREECVPSIATSRVHDSHSVEKDLFEYA